MPCAAEVDDPRMTRRGVDLFYGAKQAIIDVSLDVVPLRAQVGMVLIPRKKSR